MEGLLPVQNNTLHRFTTVKGLATSYKTLLAVRFVQFITWFLTYRLTDEILGQSDQQLKDHGSRQLLWFFLT